MSRLTSQLVFVICLAIILSVIPVPNALSSMRPPFVLLAVIFVQAFVGGMFRLSWVFFLGLILDALYLNVLGAQAFALLASSLLLMPMARRFHLFSSEQQTILVGCLCLVYQLSLLSVDILTAMNYSLIHSLLASLMGMMCWPWIKWAGDQYLLKKSI